MDIQFRYPDCIQLISNQYPNMISQTYPLISIRYPFKISCQYPGIIQLNIIRYPMDFQIYPFDIQEYPKLSTQISSSLSDPPATAAGIDPTMCTRLDYPSGSRPAHLWPHGTTFVRARPPLLQVRLLYPPCPVSLLLPLGYCHGPEALLSSTRPVWRPACRVSASGDCFWRRCATRKTSKSDVKVEKGSM